MSFKPLDLQINIGQINHVARTQHSEQSLPHLMQTQHQEQLAREAQRTQTTVMESAHTKEDDAVKDSLAREEGREQQAREEARQRQEREERPTGKTFENYESGETGSIIDIKR